MLQALSRPIRRVYRAIFPRRKQGFSGSQNYWEQRYAAGGNSGAGSYSRLAEFKAEVLNDFVREHGIQSVIEFGSGDGAQLGLARYPKYLGTDVSKTAIARCKEIYAKDPSKSFILSSDLPKDHKSELSLSLDVIYHLVEDAVFDAYMRSLFAASSRFVGVYASNDDKAWTSPHVRHRRFTDWIEKNEPAWRQYRVVKNRYPYDPADVDNTSFADFFFYAKNS